MFERPLLLWLLLGAPLFALPGLIAMVRGRRRLAGVLEALARALAFATLVMLLAGLEFPVRTGAGRLAVVAVMDESRSMAPDQAAWVRKQVGNLAAAMDPRDRLAVIGFGREVRLLSPLGDPRLAKPAGALIDGGATDLGAALTTALGLFPDASAKRLVLLSDGNETEGNAMADVGALAEDGVRIYAAAPPLSAQSRIALTALKAPLTVRAYQRFGLRIDIESEARTAVAAQLELYDRGKVAGQQTVTLRPGLNRFELPYEIDQPGAHELSVGLDTPAPLVTVNPRADTAISVIGTPRVLVVSNDPRSSLVDVLKLRHYRVDQVAPRSLAQEAGAYLTYQVVVVEDASADTLSPGAAKALNRYVAELGGGLVVTGGALADGRLKGSDLEKTLPVLFRPQPPPPTREPIAVYLCIDRSNSMSYDSRDPEMRDGERIRYAKRAAIALLKQLDDTDFVGVIAFDSQPYVLSHLQPLGEDRAELTDRIARLEPGGGTDFKEALEIAEREVLLSGLAVRQVILLTDGDTNREYHEHDILIADYAREGISVSTIRIGPDLANLRLLKDFAQATGGMFYRVRDIEQLPQLFVNLTRHTTARSRQERVVISGDPSSILSGIALDQVPPMDFVAATQAKDGAVVPLRVRQGKKILPLLASWQYGLGRAAVFTADPDSLTSLSWIRWNHYAEFWSQLMNWTMRQGESGQFDLRITNSREGVSLEAQKADSSPVAGLYCRIAGNGIVIDIVMSQLAASRYRGEAGTLPPGKYNATLILKANDLEQVFVRRPFIVPAVPADAAELRLRPPNVGLLRKLARVTGGALSITPADVLKRHGSTVTVYRSATPYELPFAIVFVLAAVLIRRRLLPG